MLACTNPQLTPIRQQAKRAKSEIASELKKEYRHHLDHYFIDQLVHASWHHSPTQTRRIWLGTWNADTLKSLFPTNHNLNSYMPPAGRYKYRKIASQLIAPLLYAYNAMIRLPRHNHILTPLLTCVSQISSRHHIASLFPQHLTRTDKPSLTTIHTLTQQHQFTYSDSAFSLTDVEVGTY